MNRNDGCTPAALDKQADRLVKGMASQSTN